MSGSGSMPSEKRGHDNNLPQNKFDKFLIEAIDEGLCSLGEPVKNSVYAHLENDCCIKKNEIPQKIEEFSSILYRIFGLGASRLEIKFMEQLHTKINVNIEWPEYDWSAWIEKEFSFTEYIKNVRKNWKTSV